MPALESFAQWLASTPPSQTIQNILWIVPAVQTVHLLAVAAVLSSMLMIGLRLLDLAARAQTVEETSRRFLPWVWWSLAVLLLTGSVLIVGEPERTLGNPSFWLKMGFLAIVTVAALALRVETRRDGRLATTPLRSPRVARFAVFLNFALWCAVAVAGRFIAYTRP